jgi:hypothetical protein
MTIEMPSEWTDLDEVTHRLYKEGKNGSHIIYSLEVTMPIVQKKIYVAHRIDCFGQMKDYHLDALAQQSRVKLAKMARLEYHRFCRPKVKKGKKK